MTELVHVGANGIRSKHRSAAWRGTANELAATLDRLEMHVLRGRRAVTLDASRPSALATAFGQWTTPGIGDPPRGQHGIFGTAAGLEVLAAARRIEELIRDDISDWPRHLAGAWAYLHSRLDPEKGQPAPQLFLVLRQAIALRALSIVQRRFDVIAGLNGVPLNANQELTDKLLAALKSSRERQLPVLMSESVTDGRDVPGFRFASTSPDKPTLDTDWAFHLAAVLVAVMRCSGAHLLTGPQSYIERSECEMLCRWTVATLGDENGDRLRVALFSGWALLYLCQEADAEGARPLGALHRPASSTGMAQVAPNPELREQLRASLHRAVHRILSDLSLQSDLHSPYFFRFGAGSQRGGQDGTLDDEPYRQEHFVVPTVPVLLSVVARLKGDLLGDRRCGQLLRKVMDSVLNGNPRVVPAQPSGANGTVNMMYLHEALGELHEAVSAIAELPIAGRARIVVRRYRPTIAIVQNQWFSGAVLTIVGVVLGIALS